MTLRIVRGIGALRSPRLFAVVWRAFAAGGNRFGMKLVHYSVQGNHLHLIIESEGKASVTRGMQGLAIRIAKRINKLLGRRGRVFNDRYHELVLVTGLEVRRALAYVLNNARRHAQQLGERFSKTWVDPCSSARAFDGWSTTLPPAPPGLLPASVVPPRTWLMVTGWRRFGAVAIDEVPGRRRGVPRG